MLHITVPLPDRVSITTARRIADEVEAAVNRRTGALVDATVTDLALSDQERRTLCAAVSLALQAVATYGEDAGVSHVDELINATVLTDLRARLDPDATRGGHQQFEDLTRQQELAADAMASEYGRSRVRRLSDGAVVIVGMTDDVERRSVCIERDGRERWRS